MRISVSTILLDTHVLLWALTDSPRLGAHARASIVGASRSLVSSVSIAEIEIKRLLGKIDCPDNLMESAVSSGFLELPLHSAHAMRLGSLPESLRTHDPFDRLLLCQAAAENATLLTADQRLLTLTGLPVQDARH